MSKYMIWNALAALILVPMTLQAGTYIPRNYLGVCKEEVSCKKFEGFLFANGFQLATCVDPSLNPYRSGNALYRELWNTWTGIDGEKTGFFCEEISEVRIPTGNPRRFPVSSYYASGIKTLQSRLDGNPVPVVADYIPEGQRFVALQNDDNIYMMNEHFAVLDLFESNLYLNRSDVATVPRAPGVYNFRTHQIKVDGKAAALLLVELNSNQSPRQAAVFVFEIEQPEICEGADDFVLAQYSALLNWHKYYLGVHPTDGDLSIRFDVREAFKNRVQY